VAWIAGAGAQEYDFLPVASSYIFSLHDQARGFTVKLVGFRQTAL